MIAQEYVKPDEWSNDKWIAFLSDQLRTLNAQQRRAIHTSRSMGIKEHGRLSAALSKAKAAQP